MYFLYSILMVVWGFVLFPVLTIRWWRYRKYPPGIRERFGRLPNRLRSDGRPTLWFHCCSVGETLSIQPLVEAIHQRFPEIRLIFSTITHSGQVVARQRFSKYGEGNTFFFPIDLASVGSRVIEWIRPAMMVIIDTEIWPNVIHQLHRRGIPVVLVNGRISRSSFRHYRLFRPVLRKVFREYRYLLMKSGEDAERILQIGAPPEKVHVTGNLKYDCAPTGKGNSETQAVALREAFAIDPAGEKLIVAGSTHPGEEEILLEALHRLRTTPGLEGTRLLIAPRHPERSDAVAVLAEKAGFRVRRRSTGAGPTRGEEVLLLDTFGELAHAYRFAAIAFVGGTLIHHGGHSIMEPALYAKPIVIGPSMENFPQIVDEFLEHGGVRQIRAGEDDRDSQIEQITEVFKEWLCQPADLETSGRAAYNVLASNRGATQKTLDVIAALYMNT